MHARISRRTGWATALILVSLAGLIGASVAASRTSATPPADPIKSTLAQVKGLKIADREAKLYDLASKEGEVDLYTSLSKLVYPPLVKAWQATYPNVKLVVYRGASEDVYAKAAAEADAAKHTGGDVIETNGTEMLFLQHRKNVLVPYRGSPFAVQIPSKFRFDTFTAARLDTFLVSWNTKLVSTPPTSFQDLATSKWKGKLGLEPTDVDWFAALYTYFTTQAKPKMTPAAATAMFKAIAANSQLINGHTALATALAAGQVQVVVDAHSQSIEQLQSAGAPLAFRPVVNPVLTRPQGMGITYNTSHPAGALLLYDWMLSPAAQKVLQANGSEPSNPYFHDASLSGFTILPLDERLVVSHYQDWLKKNEQITGVHG
jgi:iron(III) transport system substrate-binding protein